jgi:hypothetical protein
MATQPEVTAGGSRQRVLLLALAGVALIALAAVLVRPLLLGGTTAPAAAPVAPSATAAPPTTGAQIAGPSTSVAGPTPGTVKDPFRPAVGAGGAATGATTTTGAGTTTTTTVGSTTTTTGAGSAGGATAPVSGSGADGTGLK